MILSVIIFCFFGFVVLMFVFEKLLFVVIVMVVIVGLVVIGVLFVKEVFLGFVDINVILFVVMFVIGGVLFEIGMVNKIGGVVSCFVKSEC